MLGPPSPLNPVKLVPARKCVEPDESISTSVLHTLVTNRLPVASLAMPEVKPEQSTGPGLPTEICEDDTKMELITPVGVTFLMGPSPAMNRLPDESTATPS